MKAAPIDQALNAAATAYSRRWEKAGFRAAVPWEFDITWFAYILGGWKAMVSADIAPGIYIEVTYNKEKDEIYVDIYEKTRNYKLVDEHIVEINDV